MPKTYIKKIDKKPMKVGDRVLYTIPEDIEREWTITYIWDTHTEGLVVCLSRPDESKKLRIDRCSTGIVNLELLTK